MRFSNLNYCTFNQEGSALCDDQRNLVDIKSPTVHELVTSISDSPFK